MDGYLKQGELDFLVEKANERGEEVPYIDGRLDLEEFFADSAVVDEWSAALELAGMAWFMDEGEVFFVPLQSVVLDATEKIERISASCLQLA